MSKVRVVVNGVERMNNDLGPWTTQPPGLSADDITAKREDWYMPALPFILKAATTNRGLDLRIDYDDSAFQLEARWH